MKRLGLLICLLSALLVLLFCKVCLSEDDYDKIASKYESNPCIITSTQEFVVINIFAKDAKQGDSPIAIEIRTPDNSRGLIFYEFINGKWMESWIDKELKDFRKIETMKRTA